MQTKNINKVVNSVHMGGGWAWERLGKIKCGVFVSA